MFIYVILEAVAGIVAGIVIANRTKRSDNVTYGKLDRAGKITNVILAVVYACLSPFYMFLGMISEGCKGGKVRIHHANNITAAELLKTKILEKFPDAHIEMAMTGGLCSFYAEQGGLLAGFEI